MNNDLTLTRQTNIYRHHMKQQLSPIDLTFPSFIFAQIASKTPHCELGKHVEERWPVTAIKQRGGDMYGVPSVREGRQSGSTDSTNVMMAGCVSATTGPE